MMQKIKWDWYGTWVIDWLTCDRNEPSAAGWESFDIWAKAYRKANPELSEVSDLELIEDHYLEAMKPVFDSWLFFAWRFLQWPMTFIHELVWQIKLKFFFREF